MGGWTIACSPGRRFIELRWLLESVGGEDATRTDGSLRLGGTDSSVIDRLTSGAVHATDAATGSRTALLDLYHARWNPDLLAAFGLDVALPPEIRSTAGDFGVVRHPDISAPVPLRPVRTRVFPVGGGGEAG